MHARGHQVVHQVVIRCDRIKNRTNTGGFLRLFNALKAKMCFTHLAILICFALTSAQALKRKGNNVGKTPTSRPCLGTSGRVFCPAPQCMHHHVDLIDLLRPNQCSCPQPASAAPLTSLVFMGASRSVFAALKRDSYCAHKALCSEPNW